MRKIAKLFPEFDTKVLKLPKFRILVTDLDNFALLFSGIWYLCIFFLQWQHLLFYADVQHQHRMQFFYFLQPQLNWINDLFKFYLFQKLNGIFRQQHLFAFLLLLRHYCLFLSRFFFFIFITDSLLARCFDRGLNNCFFIHHLSVLSKKVCYLKKR